jgi:hypothetical protein
MNVIEKYESYCGMVTSLGEKLSDLARVSNQKAKLEYEVSTIRKEIDTLKDEGFDDLQTVNRAKRLQFASCLEDSLIMASGGSLGDSPMADFKRSKSFKELSKQQKQDFALIKNELMNKQYNIQSAMVIAEDEPSFDIKTNPLVADYISETIENLEGYDDMPADKIRKIKEIMYIFVEHVSI